jgi:hypothetical protein
MSFSNFTSGNSHSFGGKYVELVPHELIRYTDKFDGPSLPGEMQVTVTLKKVSVGTDVSIVQEGVPDVIPFEACYLGGRNLRCSWQSSSRRRFRSNWSFVSDYGCSVLGYVTYNGCLVELLIALGGKYENAPLSASCGLLGGLRSVWRHSYDACIDKPSVNHLTRYGYEH